MANVDLRATALSLPAARIRLESVTSLERSPAEPLPSRRCRSGGPYWDDVAPTITARPRADKRTEVAARICQAKKAADLGVSSPHITSFM